MEIGVSGIVVSNHGARQLDYTPATISVLEEVMLLPKLRDKFDQSIDHQAFQADFETIFFVSNIFC